MINWRQFFIFAGSDGNTAKKSGYPLHGLIEKSMSDSDLKTNRPCSPACWQQYLLVFKLILRLVSSINPCNGVSGGSKYRKTRSSA